MESILNFIEILNEHAIIQIGDYYINNGVGIIIDEIIINNLRQEHRNCNTIILRPKNIEPKIIKEFFILLADKCHKLKLSCNNEILKTITIDSENLFTRINKLLKLRPIVFFTNDKDIRKIINNSITEKDALKKINSSKKILIDYDEASVLVNFFFNDFSENKIEQVRHEYSITKKEILEFINIKV